MLPRWFVRQRGVLAAGLGLTAAGAVLHVSGLTEQLELLGYDFHVRHFSQIPASDRIVHIDLDDDAYRRVGSWPWPRDLQGQVIRILAELGAEHIVPDLVWSERKPAEVRLPSLDPYADLEGDIEQVGEVSEENFVYPDLELAYAIRQAGNVCLAMYYDRKEEAAAGASSELREAVADLLADSFELDEEAMAERLGRPVEQIQAVLPGAKRAAALRRAREVLLENPSATLRDVHAALLSTPFDRLTRDRADVVAGYDQARCLAQMRERLLPVPPALRGRIPAALQVSPPLFTLTAVARRLGCVKFDEDEIDGSVRHLPLVAEWEGLLLEQLSFAVARDVLNIQPEDLSIDEAGDLRIAARGERPTMRVQLDGQGRLLINWHSGARRWENCFEHIPVARVLQVYDCRKNLRENAIRRQLAIADALALTMEPGDYASYCGAYNARLHLERRVHLAELKNEVHAPEVEAARPRIEELSREIATTQRDHVTFIKEVWAELQAEEGSGFGVQGSAEEERERGRGGEGETPADEGNAIAPGASSPTSPPEPEAMPTDDYQRFQEANDILTGRVAELERANRQLAAEEQRLIAELRPLVAGKICFIGYTATAVADMVTTPPYQRIPGVMVHSAVLNSFLQGQFRAWSGRGTQVAVILLLGAIVTGVTVSRGPRVSLALVVTLLAASFALNAVGMFRLMDVWLRLLTGIALTFVIWALIVMLRYLVTDRERRRFSRAVAQYVSPAMARRIGESAEQLDLAPARGEVTCFFSDLQGFTTISERLGPEGTRSVLNPYLEVMSSVLHRHEALINKFMGDGIFAFFNPPILPCPQHVLAACEAALDSQRALRELVARFDDHPLAEEFRRLFTRIGIASGPVFVGDYGSENKLDYTCMGDTVNLAARLEAANKQFSTATMLSGTCRDAVGDRYVYRHLGAVQVKGQTAVVHIYELLGRTGEVDDEQMRFAEVYGEAVVRFARRDWEGAARGFGRCLELRPADRGAPRHLDAIREYASDPPPDGWAGGIELTEK